MLFNYCQLWRWTDGQNTVTMITGGMCVMLTSNRGHIDTIEILQLSISATEQGQNYCNCLFVWHESFMSLWAGQSLLLKERCKDERNGTLELLWDKSFISTRCSLKDPTGGRNPPSPPTAFSIPYTSIAKMQIMFQCLMMWGQPEKVLELQKE